MFRVAKCFSVSAFNSFYLKVQKWPNNINFFHMSKQRGHSSSARYLQDFMKLTTFVYILCLTPIVRSVDGGIQTSTLRYT
jgi:hypothetical protein